MAAGNLDEKQEWEGIGETRGRCNGARAHRAKAQGRDVLGGRGWRRGGGRGRAVGDNERVRGASRNIGGRGLGTTGAARGADVTCSGGALVIAGGLDWGGGVSRERRWRQRPERGGGSNGEEPEGAVRDTEAAGGGSWMCSAAAVVGRSAAAWSGCKTGGGAERGQGR
jgi:hypothetical protein